MNCYLQCVRMSPNTKSRNILCNLVEWTPHYFFLKYISIFTNAPLGKKINMEYIIMIKYYKKLIMAGKKGNSYLLLHNASNLSSLSQLFYFIIWLVESENILLLINCSNMHELNIIRKLLTIFNDDNTR